MEGSTPSEAPGWYVEFQASVLRQLPRPEEITPGQARNWRENQDALRSYLRTSLTSVGEERQNLSSHCLVNSNANPAATFGGYEYSIMSHERMGLLELVSTPNLLKVNGNPALFYWAKDQALLKGRGVKGTDILNELRTKGEMNLNSCVLEMLLKKQNLIPKAWEDHERIYFWGTRYITAGNISVVRCLRRCPNHPKWTEWSSEINSTFTCHYPAVTVEQCG